MAVRLVLQRTLAVLLVASAVGVGAALSASRWLTSIVWGIVAADLATISVATLSLGAVGIIAALIPGWRAGRVDPIVLLRAE